MKNVKELKDKGVAPAEIGRIAFLIDPDLPEKLGVPKPDSDDDSGGSHRRGHH